MFPQRKLPPQICIIWNCAILAQLTVHLHNAMCVLCIVPYSLSRSDTKDATAQRSQTNPFFLTILWMQQLDKNLMSDFHTKGASAKNLDRVWIPLTVTSGQNQRFSENVTALRPRWRRILKFVPYLHLLGGWGAARFHFLFICLWDSPRIQMNPCN